MSKRKIVRCRVCGASAVVGKGGKIDSNAISEFINKHVHNGKGLITFTDLQSAFIYKETQANLDDDFPPPVSYNEVRRYPNDVIVMSGDVYRALKMCIAVADND